MRCGASLIRYGKIGLVWGFEDVDDDFEDCDEVWMLRNREGGPEEGLYRREREVRVRGIVLIRGHGTVQIRCLRERESPGSMRAENNIFLHRDRKCAVCRDTLKAKPQVVMWQRQTADAETCIRAENRGRKFSVIKEWAFPPRLDVCHFLNLEDHDLLDIRRDAFSSDG